MIVMLTKHPSYSFSCFTLSLCVFCRNEENETKSKQFEQELKKLCKEESMVVTTSVYGHDHNSKLRGRLCSKVSVWLRPQKTFSNIFRYGFDHSFPLQQLRSKVSVWSRATPIHEVAVFYMQCGHDHKHLWSRPRDDLA